MCGARSFGPRIKKVLRSTGIRSAPGELEEQIEEGQRFNDPERAARAHSELEALMDELGAALGFGGRSRRVPGSAEHARQSVTKAICASVRRLAEHDPRLGAHLTRAIRTGGVCRYDPDPRALVSWTL